MLVVNLNITKTFATDYNLIANEMKNSVNMDELISEESAEENIDAYQGADVNQANYYNDESSMHSNAASQMITDKNVEVVTDSNSAVNKYDIDLNEDWLKNANEVSAKPYDTLDLITNTYADCSANARSCRLYQGINNETCNAERVIEVDNYHKFQCNKDKLQYNINCTDALNVNCTSTHYSLPPVIHQKFHQFSFSGTTLHLGVNRSRGSCNGIDFDFSFRINSTAEIEEFIYNRIDVDDKADLYINGKLVHRTTSTKWCELSRTSRSYPNLNLKSYLKAGENTITIKHYIGGLGNLNAWFSLKYKTCNNYSQNDFTQSCEATKFSGDNCIETNKVCTETGELRHIGNGVYEYRDCWKYQVTKTCTPTNYINYCEELENTSSCSQLNTECINNGANSCLQYKNTHRCTENDISIIDNQTTHLGYFQDIVKEYVDYTACDDLDTSSSCSLTNESCEAIGLRRVNGLEIDRDCWQYKRSYACEDSDLTHSSCSELESQCSYVDAECKETDISGICIEYQRNYSCTNNSHVEDSDEQIVVCNSQVYCDNGDCDEINYDANTDLAITATFASMLENAAEEFDEDSSITFAGTNSKCSRDFLDLSDCCTMNGFFETAIESSVAFLQWSTGSGLIKSISGSGEEIGDTGLDLSFCSSLEKDLFFRRNNNQCIYIGRYCSAEEDLTGLCLQEKESYCCFSSKIAKIIQQQGRIQLGKGWGTPFAPNCTGLSVDELNQLDLEAIDFSELEAEIKDNALNNIPESSDLEGIVIETIQDFYQSNQEDE